MSLNKRKRFHNSLDFRIFADVSLPYDGTIGGEGICSTLKDCPKRARRSPHEKECSIPCRFGFGLRESGRLQQNQLRRHPVRLGRRGGSDLLKRGFRFFY